MQDLKTGLVEILMDGILIMFLSQLLLNPQQLTPDHQRYAEMFYHFLLI
jgi:hypothetical protein